MYDEFQRVPTFSGGHTAPTPSFSKGKSTQMADPISGLVGIAIGSGATGLIAWFTRRGQINDARRKAYANWVGAVALMSNRMTRICMTPFRPPDDADGKSTFRADIEALYTDTRALLAALSEVLFLEHDATLRSCLTVTQEKLVQMADNLDVIEKFLRDGKGRDTEANRQNVPLGADDAARHADLIVDNDIEPGVVLEEYRATSLETLTKLNSAVDELRELLARLRGL